MLFQNAVAVITLTGLVSAAPAKNQPRILQHDDVILPRADGGFDIMKDWEWSDMERRLENEQRAAAMEAKRAALAGELVPAGAVTSGLASRGCEESSEVQVLTDTTFTDWDVAMSPVIGATGGGASVEVTKGYSVSNSLTIGTGIELTLVKDVFMASLSIDYSTEWTTEDSQTFSFSVNTGEYGVVVSNPLTRRVTGNYLDGCTDSPTTTSFTADSRTSQTYTDLSWVSGPIRLCNSTTYPVPYCVGTGSHS